MSARSWRTCPVRRRIMIRPSFSVQIIDPDGVKVRSHGPTNPSTIVVASSVGGAGSHAVSAAAPKVNTSSEPATRDTAPRATAIDRRDPFMTTTPPPHRHPPLGDAAVVSNLAPDIELCRGRTRRFTPWCASTRWVALGDVAQDDGVFARADQG